MEKKGAEGAPSIVNGWGRLKGLAGGQGEKKEAKGVSLIVEGMARLDIRIFLVCWC